MDELKRGWVVTLLGDPERVSLSGRILNLLLLVNFVALALASIINLLLGFTLLALGTAVGAIIFLVSYYCNPPSY